MNELIKKSMKISNILKAIYESITNICPCQGSIPRPLRAKLHYVYKVDRTCERVLSRFCETLYSIGIYRRTGGYDIIVRLLRI